MNELKNIIERAYTQSGALSSDIRDAVTQVITALNNGTLRVAEKQNGQWVVNQWVKKAVPLFVYIKIHSLKAQRSTLRQSTFKIYRIY